MQAIDINQLVAVDCISVEIDVPIRSLNGLLAGNWGAKHAIGVREREAVRTALEGLIAPKWDRYVITLVRCASKYIDSDNLWGAFKHVRDELANWLQLNDGCEIIEWRYDQKLVREIDGRHGHPKWRTYGLVEIATPQAAGTASPAAHAPVGYVEKAVVKDRPAKPVDAHGCPVVDRELGSRAPAPARLHVTLCKNLVATKTGLPVGTFYLRLSVQWMYRDMPWRTQGVTVRLEEVDALIEALEELRAKALAGG